MSWKDRLMDASFKNVPFKVKSVEDEFGRRTQVHQFANREKPYVQDLGGDIDTFTVTGFVIQNIENSFDYFSERDNLIRVLKSAGAGNLVHPYLGIKRVSLIGPAKKTESFEEGGMATFTMTFKEAGERALPQALTDFVSMVDKKVNQAMDTVGDAFYVGFSTLNLFQDSISNIISRAIGSIQVGLTSMSGIATKIISESVSNVNIIRNTNEDIVNTPNSIFNAIKNCAYSMASSCGMGDVLLKEQETTTGFADENSLATIDRSVDTYKGKISISTTTTGGQKGDYSGIIRGDVVELDSNNINRELGKSVINNIISAIENFDMSGLGACPTGQQKNIALILDIFKFCMIACVCRVAIRTDFFGQEEMIEFMNMISAMIENVLIDMGAEAADGTIVLGIGNGTDPIDNKDIFLSIENIRNIFVENMLLKSFGVTKAIDYTIPPDIETTLELAYDKYLDLNRSNEIYRTNKNIIQHPGFMPSGDVIRILDK